SVPSLLISNYVLVYDSLQKAYITWPDDLVQADFGNSIIYGNLDNELEISSLNDQQMNYYFDHCLLRVNTDSVSVEDTSHFRDIIINKDPRFVRPVANYEEPVNLQLDTLSPAKDTGSIQIGTTVPFDYDGNSRLQDKAPDLGAYERIDSTELAR
ncbi:MAG TPA: choice-of-anchor Q domain-containing protein, partial [Bacteroidales bacterium]|nr:choice-of-anchor Q domain-containing protein [Bacteroidales bacterium]